MRSLSFAAILLGGIVDVFLSSALGTLLVFEAVYTRGLNRVPKEQLQGAITSLMHHDVRLYALQMSIGFVCSVIGGWVAASIAKERRLLNGVLASWLCVTIGLISLLRRYDAMSLAAHTLLIVATPFCYLLGAAIRQRMSRSAAV